MIFYGRNNGRHHTRQYRILSLRRRPAGQAPRAMAAQHPCHSLLALRDYLIPGQSSLAIDCLEKQRQKLCQVPLGLQLYDGTADFGYISDRRFNVDRLFWA